MPVSFISATLLLAAGCSGTDAGGGGVVPPIQDLADTGSSRTAWIDPQFGSIVHVTWQQEESADTWVEYRVQGEDWRSTPPRHLDPGAAEELLLGLPYGASIEYRVTTDRGAGPVRGADQALETGPVPDTLPVAELRVPDDGRGDPALRYLYLSLKGLSDQEFADWVAIVDRQGRPVWALENPSGFATVHPRVSIDGTHLIVDHNSQWGVYDQGAASELVRLRIDGSELARIPTPGMRHPYTELPDGSIVYGRWAEGQEETLEQVAPDGTHTTLYSCQQWMADNGLVGGCGSNSLSWDPATDHFLYSLYSMETVIEIDRATGETVRWFGRAPGAWNFADVDTAFWWQHGAVYTEAGTLLVSARRGEDIEETVVREYVLDEDVHSLVQVASLGEGSGIYAEVMGEAWRLGNGNTLHNLGSAARVREYTPEGTVVWELAWPASYIGRSTPIEDLYALLR